MYKYLSDGSIFSRCTHQSQVTFALLGWFIFVFGRPRWWCWDTCITTPLLCKLTYIRNNVFLVRPHIQLVRLLQQTLPLTVTRLFALVRRCPGASRMGPPLCPPRRGWRRI